jgi:hypothetical protein
MIIQCLKENERKLPCITRYYPDISLKEIRKTRKTKAERLFFLPDSKLASHKHNGSAYHNVKKLCTQVL